MFLKLFFGITDMYSKVKLGGLILFFMLLLAMNIALGLVNQAPFWLTVGLGVLAMAYRAFIARAVARSWEAKGFEPDHREGWRIAVNVEHRTVAISGYVFPLSDINNMYWRSYPRQRNQWFSRGSELELFLDHPGTPVRTVYFSDPSDANLWAARLSAL